MIGNTHTHGEVKRQAKFQAKKNRHSERHREVKRQAEVLQPNASTKDVTIKHHTSITHRLVKRHANVLHPNSSTWEALNTHRLGQEAGNEDSTTNGHQLGGCVQKSLGDRISPSKYGGVTKQFLQTSPDMPTLLLRPKCQLTLFFEFLIPKHDWASTFTLCAL